MKILIICITLLNIAFAGTITNKQKTEFIKLELGGEVLRIERSYFGKLSLETIDLSVLKTRKAQMRESLVMSGDLFNEPFGMMKMAPYGENFGAKFGAVVFGVFIDALCLPVATVSSILSDETSGKLRRDTALVVRMSKKMKIKAVNDARLYRINLLLDKLLK